MSDEVSQFLEQVERLRGQQIEEDDVRARELEDYLAAKRERQARREGEQRNRKEKKKTLAIHCRCCTLAFPQEAFLVALMALPLLSPGQHTPSYTRCLFLGLLLLLFTCFPTVMPWL